MCGIAGFVGEGDQGDLERMTRWLAHRGPDAEGFYVEQTDGVYLGHRRLSIIDLPAARSRCRWRMDVASLFSTARSTITWSCALNWSRSGCVFQSDHSDTEVLLHGYRLWGEEIVRDAKRHVGLCALGCPRKSDCCISRDRFGKKPLFWFQLARERLPLHPS